MESVENVEAQQYSIAEGGIDRNAPYVQAPACSSPTWWCDHSFTIAFFRQVSKKFRGSEGIGWALSGGLASRTSDVVMLFSILQYVHT